MNSVHVDSSIRTTSQIPINDLGKLQFFYIKKEEKTTNNYTSISADLNLDSMLAFLDKIISLDLEIDSMLAFPGRTALQHIISA